MQTTPQSRCKVSSNWADENDVAAYRSGVSLHSHTSMSEETLTFIHKGLGLLPGVGRIFEHYDHKAKDHGLKLDFVRGHWRPPLVPRMAYELESSQIRGIGLEPLVSITDHDTIAAPQVLRNVAGARGIPVSLEWTVPFGATEFHLGIHNLPSGDAFAWTARLAGYTAAPNQESLRTILGDLQESPGVLVILNHPVWDLHKIGVGSHERELGRFLARYGRCLHGLELNGLRDARENRVVAQLARESDYVLMSGGDRHGMEPSACINLSQARTFGEFVYEVRHERRSHIHFMDQYKRPWEQRIFHATLDAVTDFPDFPMGWQRWDDRAFHPDRDGNMRPLSQLWENGLAPWALRAAIQLVRMGRCESLARTLGRAFACSIDVGSELESL